MISHSHKFIFLHIPKTAGISIRRVFRENKMLSDEYSSGHPRLFDYRLLLGRKFDEYFVFTFVRNPFDRFVSTFVFLKNGGTGCQHDLQMQERLNRYKTINELCRHEKIVDICVHFRPQCYFMDNQYPNQSIGYVGKLETLQEDFNIICDKIGIPREELPHENSSNHKHYTEYYDNESQKIITEIYRKDIDMFGYTFGE